MTQDELAKELGVTATAVSKWETGYTLPDILMLCALADFFDVTTDELLGRNQKTIYCLVAACSPEIGTGIRDLVKSFGFTTRQICSTYTEAFALAEADRSITHLFAGFCNPTSDEEKNKRRDDLYCIESQASTREQILDGFKIYLQNMSSYDSITQKHPAATR